MTRRRLTSRVLKPLSLLQLLLLLLLLQADSSHAVAEEELFHFFDEYSHECVRNCTAEPQPRSCQYRFRIEWYITMSKACFNCPLNLTDCYRPHCITADGVKRALFTVNRQLSAPGIHVCKGDTVQVTVDNHMEMGEAVSLHWHGLHMRNTQHMDGVAMVSQCPINAHSQFVYRFVASPSGTHFYHAHSGLQRTEGLFGPLVVRESTDPQAEHYDHDLPQHTLLLADWFHELGANKFASHHYGDGDNKPKGLIINGRGAFASYGPDSKLHTPRHVLAVQQGSRYRIRIISSASLNCPFVVSVSNHSLLVIGSDGRPLRPISVQSLVIYAGERFDLVLAASQPVGNYLLRVVGIADCDQRFTSARQSAIVSYEGADAWLLQGSANPSYQLMLPAAGGKQLNPFNRKADAEHVPITRLQSFAADRPVSLERVDKKFYLAFDFEIVNNTRYHHPAYYPISAVRKSDGHLYTPQINNVALSLPRAPILYQLADVGQEYLCNNTEFDRSYETDFVECHHALRVNLNDVVEIVLIDKGVTFNASHPFHLHGHYFQVIGLEKVGDTLTVEEVKAMDAAGRLRRNLTAPPVKDTVIVPDGGYTVIRFKADNPGPWLFHCHLEWHVEVGMGVLLLVGDPAAWAERVPGNFPRCGDWTSPGPGVWQLAEQQLAARYRLRLLCLGAAAVLAAAAAALLSGLATSYCIHRRRKVAVTSDS